jgi:hypothetical protein
MKVRVALLYQLDKLWAGGAKTDKVPLPPVLSGG